MKAPAFWWREPGVAARLLAPAAALYATVADRRLPRPGSRAEIPVVCIGNMTVGGTGKTPTAIAMAGLLREAGWRPAILTRGYRGRLSGPIVVDPLQHRATDVGDEALLLARAAPTIVSGDRPAGAALAAAEGADLILMDDGLQNPSLAKNFALAVFDGETGLGNGLTLPAGPLRATAAAQWPRIDAALVIGRGSAGDAVAAEAGRRGIPVHHARIVAEPAGAARLGGRRVLAFAGIGQPQKLVASLRECGADVVAQRAFPDHHAFTPRQLDAILDEAASAGLVPVTTEKDLVRIAGSADTAARLPRFDVLPITIAFADPGAVMRGIAARLAPYPSPAGSGRPSRVSTALGDT